jgi:hypothetical protein
MSISQKQSKNNYKQLQIKLFFAYFNKKKTIPNFDSYPLKIIKLQIVILTLCCHHAGVDPQWGHGLGQKSLSLRNTFH